MIRRLLYCLIAFLLPLVSCAEDLDTPRWKMARERMVEEVIIGGGIQNVAVQDAMRNTLRHQFVPESRRSKAYLDMGLPIGGRQTITSPFVVARMTEALDPQPTDRVLEIGTGSGYQAAVLSEIVAEVYSIEIVESLARRAKRTLKRLDYENVFTLAGDGYLGWPEHAPYDKMIVTCSPEKIPKPLVDQLREGGQIVAPLGERFQQSLQLLTKVDGKLQFESIEPTFFVPMTGQAEVLREVLSGDMLPQLVNGDFEDQEADGSPKGWYYVRQCQIVEDTSAPDGTHSLRLQNHIPGQGSQALQAVGMDGREVREIEIAAWISGRSLGAGQNSDQTPRIEITFYNQGRAAISTSSLGPWTGTFEWKNERRKLRVPRQARLAVVWIALYGGVGEMMVDQLQVHATKQEQSTASRLR